MEVYGIQLWYGLGFLQNGLVQFFLYEFHFATSWCACFVCRMDWTVWAILNDNEAWNPAWMIVLQSSSFLGRVKKIETPPGLPWCCRCLVYRKDFVLRADCQVSAEATRQATPCLHVREWVCEHGADHSWCDNFRRERHEGRPGYHGEGEGEGEGCHGEGDGEGDGSQGDGDGEQCSGQIQTFAIQISVREFQVLVGTAFLRLPKVCPEQILVESRAKYDKNQKVSGQQRQGLVTICCQRELIFDAACEWVLSIYTRCYPIWQLSEKVHQPPGLAVLNLTDPPYTEHVYLLRDLGVHYSKKLNLFNLFCESVDLSQALGDLMKRDLASWRKGELLVIPYFKWELWRLQWTMG